MSQDDLREVRNMERKSRAAGRVRQIIPVICVVDVASTLAFYVERLGFAKQYVVDDPPRYAVVERDGQIVHFRQAETATPGNAFHLYVWTDGLDGFYAECVQEGVKITRPPG